MLCSIRLAGGTPKPSRNLDYLDQGNDNRRACSLYLSIMDRGGSGRRRPGGVSAGPTGHAEGIAPPIIQDGSHVLAAKD